MSKNSRFWCVGLDSAVWAIGSGSGFRVYPILDPSPIPKNPNPEIYPNAIWKTRFQKLVVQKFLLLFRFVPDFASTTGHSIPDPDDPETRFTRKNPGSRPENRVFFNYHCLDGAGAMHVAPFDVVGRHSARDSGGRREAVARL